jgi:hypothetical protein
MMSCTHVAARASAPHPRRCLADFTARFARAFRGLPPIAAQDRGERRRQEWRLRSRPGSRSGCAKEETDMRPRSLLTLAPARLLSGKS